MDLEVTLFYHLLFPKSEINFQSPLFSNNMEEKSLKSAQQFPRQTEEDCAIRSKAPEQLLKDPEVRLFCQDHNGSYNRDETFSLIHQLFDKIFLDFSRISWQPPLITDCCHTWKSRSPWQLSKFTLQMTARRCGWRMWRKSSEWVWNTDRNAGDRRSLTCSRGLWSDVAVTLMSSPSGHTHNSDAFISTNIDQYLLHIVMW